MTKYRCSGSGFRKLLRRCGSNSPNSDSNIDLIDGVDALLEDLDDDVQEAGVQLNTLIIKGHDASKEEELEEEEKAKL